MLLRRKMDERDCRRWVLESVEREPVRAMTTSSVRVYLHDKLPPDDFILNAPLTNVVLQ